MAQSTLLILSQSHHVQMQYPIPNHEAQLLCHSRCHHINAERVARGLLEVFTTGPPILPLRLPRRAIASPTPEQQGRREASRSFRCQARQDAGQGCVVLAPSPRSCVSPLRLAPPLHAGSVAKVPPARPQFDKYRLVLLFANPFFYSFSNAAFIVILCCTSAWVRQRPNQQHQRQYQHSAALLDRFSRSHAIIGSCFFPPRLCAAYYTSYPASSALTRKETSSAEETAQSQLSSKWLTTARKTMTIPVATCART